MTTADLGGAALAMDAVLTSSDAAEIIDAVRAHAPTWLVDQLAAAEAQVDAGMRSVAAVQDDVGWWMPGRRPRPRRCRTG